MSSAASYERQRRRFGRWAIAPSLAFLLVVAGLPTLFLLVDQPHAGGARRARLAQQLQRAAAQLQAAGRRRPLRQFARCVQAQLSVYTVVLQVLLGTGAGAAGAFRAASAGSALRHLFVIPMVLPPIVVAVIWKLIYTPDISPIYQAAKALGMSRCRR